MEGQEKGRTAAPPSHQAPQPPPALRTLRASASLPASDTSEAPRTRPGPPGPCRNSNQASAPSGPTQPMGVPGALLGGAPDGPERAKCSRGGRRS